MSEGKDRTTDTTRLPRDSYGVARLIHPLRDSVRREKQFLYDEIQLVSGLMPLLMKPRNQQPWTREDKVLLAGHMRRLSRLSPYLAVLVIPGGFLMLPALAWWLDRRRHRARSAPSS